MKDLILTFDKDSEDKVQKTKLGGKFKKSIKHLNTDINNLDLQVIKEQTYEDLEESKNLNDIVDFIGS